MAVAASSSGEDLKNMDEAKHKQIVEVSLREPSAFRMKMDFAT